MEIEEKEAMKRKKKSQGVRIRVSEETVVLTETEKITLEPGDVITVYSEEGNMPGSTSAAQNSAVYDQPDPTPANPDVRNYRYDTDGAQDRDQVIDPEGAETDDPAEGFESEFDTEQADDSDQVMERKRRRSRSRAGARRRRDENVRTRRRSRK